MTEREFIDSYKNAPIGSLIGVCYDYGIDDIVCDWYSEDSFNEYVEEEISRIMNDDGWRHAQSWASELPDSGYDWYFYNGDEFYGVDNYDYSYIDELFDEVHQAMIDGNLFEDAAENYQPSVSTDEELICDWSVFSA